MAPSSAWASASRMTANPPMTHEISAAGPAIVDALSAPKSQPEPIIEPTDVNSSPTTPISRRRRWVPPAAARGSRPMGALASIVDTVPPRFAARIAHAAQDAVRAVLGLRSGPEGARCDRSRGSPRGGAGAAGPVSGGLCERGGEAVARRVVPRVGGSGAHERPERLRRPGDQRRLRFALERDGLGAVGARDVEDPAERGVGERRRLADVALERRPAGEDLRRRRVAGAQSPQQVALEAGRLDELAAARVTLRSERHVRAVEPVERA